MDNPLTYLGRLHDSLQGTRNGFTIVKQRWYTWNYWAQHHSLFSFDNWMDENGLKFRDIKAKANYPDADVVYNREEGYRYYSAWRGAQAALDAAEEEFDEQFRRLWEERLPDGQPVYSNEELGKAIGKDGEALRKFAAKRSWYYPRKTKGTQ